MVVLASILPARGSVAVSVRHATTIAIAFLFFLYGARLSRASVVNGFTNWRLQWLVIASTFVIFPILGILLQTLARPLLGPSLAAGLLFLCLLPSTVQSSIAFTSIAAGNVPAALCAATVSNLVGVLLTPALVGLLMSSTVGSVVSTGTVTAIVVQILLPFAAGQLLRPWLAEWTGRNRRILSYLDRGSILLVVYAAFSEGVVNGIWHRLAVANLLSLIVVCGALLAILLALTTTLSRRLGFNRGDEVAIVFCGSKKSLASGIPMANILFPASTVGMFVLPLMIFHQIQLMVCAAMARRYAARQQAEEASELVG